MHPIEVGRGVHKRAADTPDCAEMSLREPGDTSEIPILASADALEAVPGYTLIRFLGEGALARAYECRAERTGEIVVVKVLNKDAAGDRAAVQRLLRDSRVVAGIRSHAHVVRIHDVGEAQAGPYVVFERLKGTDLRSRMKEKGRLPVPDALAAVRDAARALEAAAAVGVVHRDVKPSNLFLLDDGTVKLTDFGFAAPLSRLGGPAGVYGTPELIAPELLRGGAADIRTDIYALGATLFQLVTARPLFEGSTADVLAAHQKKPVPSIATLVPDAGIVVVDILYRLLQKDPSRRAASATDVVKFLDEAVARSARTRTSAPIVGARAPSLDVDPGAPTLIHAMPSAPAVKRPRQEIARQPQAAAASPFDASQEGTAGGGNPFVGQPTGVMGTLKQMSVTEIIQMLEIGKKSARIELQAMDGLKGLLHIHDGQLVHCAADAATGEPAVVELCRRKEGFFRIHYDKEACEKNIHRPTTFVLLEAMRQLDEGATVALPAPPLPAVSEEPVGPAKPAARPPVAPPVPSPAPPPRRPPGPPPRPALAREREPSGKSAARRSAPSSPPQAVGDGIQWGDSSANHSHIEDPTLPESALRIPGPGAVGRVGAGATSAGQQIVAEARALYEELSPKAVEALHATVRAARQLFSRADVALEPLRAPLARLHPRLGELRPLVVVSVGVGAVLALLVALAIALGSGPLDAERGALAVLQGKAGRVIEELERIPAAERTLGQDLVLAHAHAASLDDDRALELYGIAVPAGVTDSLALGFLLSRLDASMPDDEMDLLVLWPDPEVEEVLTELTVDPRFFTRANAVAVLVERGALGRIDVERTSILDVNQGSCGARRAALQTLRVAGKTPAALVAVESAGRTSEGCFGNADLRPVAAAIEKRL
jgi:serine/threonine protein kinase